MSDPNYEVVNKRIEQSLNRLGGMLREATASHPGYGFALLIFKFGEGGELFYTSNADRADICKVMAEFIERQNPGKA
jgi:hypothetical protein